METIFDHNPTKGELLNFEVSRLDGLSQDSHFGLISDLYAIRKDKETAVKYASKISEEAVRMDRLFLLGECPVIF